MLADTAKFLCYRLTYRSQYDEEVIWAFVQRSGGHISIRQDCIDYWITPRYQSLLLCAWPELEPQPQLDLY
jgi:hypothetical protein